MRKFLAIALAGFASIIGAGSVSATIVDLTSYGASGYIEDAFFEQIDPDPTGTGYIDPFLRIQANNVEQGVNSDGPYTMDEKSGIWTHSILVSTFGRVVNPANDIESIRFMLDINESDTQVHRYIGLDQLKVYVADSPDYNTVALLDANGTLVYDMDALDDSAVHLNYGLNSGSGSGDMFAWLPAELFDGHESQYLYLYSQFGGEGPPWDTNDGFEEWTNIDSPTPPPPQVPEPATLILLGGGLLGVGLMRRRRH